MMMVMVVTAALGLEYSFPLPKPNGGLKNQRRGADAFRSTAKTGR
jgi:hypothetical protein